MRAYMASDHDIFHRRHVGKQPDVLKRPRNAQCCHLVGFETRHGTISQRDHTGIGGVETGQDIEQCCLASSIGADQAVNFAGNWGRSGRKFRREKFANPLPEAPRARQNACSHR